ncbi:MAG: aldo/keto reductase [Anaerolineae bacterium]|nr:aldo/keto reductase [Anaerolineae bacterium]
MTIAKIPFGRTGHLSTRTLFGAAALGSVTQDADDRTLDLLLEYGVNHIDTAASYGESELRIGPCMAQHRKHFFLATKTGKRTYTEAREEFHRSLDRLRVDSADLIQLHYLVADDEWKVAMRPGGALEYLIEARDQGLVKYIGVTGHDVAVTHSHLNSLDVFDFDSVLLPYNYVMMKNSTYAAGFNAVLALARSRGIAVQTIKAITRRPYHGEPTHAVWYEPLTQQDAIDKAVHWVLGQPDVFLNTVGDVTLLPKVLDAASRFERRPSDAEMDAVITEWAMEPLFT